LSEGVRDREGVGGAVDEGEGRGEGGVWSEVKWLAGLDVDCDWVFYWSSCWIE
jgi:hypothetical protein